MTQSKKEKYAKPQNIYRHFRHVSSKILKIYPLYVIIIVATQSEYDLNHCGKILW